MSVEEIVKTRGIKTVTHFTTNNGALGILASRAAKSRTLLSADDQLQHVFRPNADNRSRDEAWKGYLNLSISKPNSYFFSVSRRWHRRQDFWWCIFCFSPKILSHPGVIFTTTNNIYSGVVRGEGAKGLEACFSNSIVHWNEKKVARSDSVKSEHTTCEQAEVLYPQQLSTEFLDKIVVQNADDSDELAAQMAVVEHREVSIVVEPDMFPEAS